MHVCNMHVCSASHVQCTYNSAPPPSLPDLSNYLHSRQFELFHPSLLIILKSLGEKCLIRPDSFHFPRRRCLTTSLLSFSLNGLRLNNFI